MGVRPKPMGAPVFLAIAASKSKAGEIAADTSEPFALAWRSRSASTPRPYFDSRGKRGFFQKYQPGEGNAKKPCLLKQGFLGKTTRAAATTYLKHRHYPTSPTLAKAKKASQIA
jgi:hypothetical protein